MLSQEEFLDELELHRRDWPIDQIAVEVGQHPQTVSKWIRAGGPPARRAPVTDPVIDERLRGRIDELLAKNRQLKATSIVWLRARGLRCWLRDVDEVSAGTAGPPPLRR
jgi:transposase-like protein